MSWRLEGWKNPFLEIDIVPVEGVVATGILEHKAFESGADAMLLKVCEEIEKVKTLPHARLDEGATPEEPAYYHGFDEACDEILSRLRS